MTEREITFRKINRLILDEKFSEAAQELKSLNSQDPVDQRIIGHFSANIMFRQGRLKEAQTLMRETISKYGENVNLLRDLMACQYHGLDLTEFRENLNRLEILIAEKEAQLSNQSLFDCELFMGKFFEEEAKLAPAFLFFERALRRAQQPEQRTQALLQKARLHALYEPNQDLSQYYRELISYPSHLSSKDLRIELEHTLMLIELRLVGADHAWLRVEKLKDTVTELDLKLLLFDFIEGCLVQDFVIPEEVQTLIVNLKHLDPYEDYLNAILSKKSHDPIQRDHLNHLASKVSWASYLRILCLATNIESNPATKQELNRKIQLIIMGLDSKTQELWNARLKQALKQPEVRLDFSLEQRCLTIQGKTLDLSKKKMSLQLLEGLAKRPSLSVDDAIHQLWQSTFSPEHYHRLRMGVHRFNTLVHEATGLGKIVEVDSQNVRLRPEVKLKRTDETNMIGLF